MQNDGYDLDRDRQAATARLNALLDRAGDEPLPPVATEPEVGTIPEPRELVARALSQRPEVRRAQLRLGMAQRRAELAQKENLPELSIWSGYMAAFGGTNTFTVGISSSLPFFGTVKKRALAGAAETEIEAARRGLVAAQRETEAQVRTSLLQLIAADRHVRLHAEKLIPLADLTMQSAQASYEAGRVSFSTVLEAARMVRDHHLNHLKFLVEYEKSVADLSELTGEAP
jgi:outer membrane protein TolC